MFVSAQGLKDQPELIEESILATARITLGLDSCVPMGIDYWKVAPQSEWLGDRDVISVCIRGWAALTEAEYVLAEAQTGE